MNIQDWFPLELTGILVVQGTLKSLLQHHSSKASIFQHSAFFMVQCSHPYMTTGKTIALTIKSNKESVTLCPYFPLFKLGYMRVQVYKHTYNCNKIGYLKSEHKRIDAFELWCWRKLLRVPWTTRRSNQSVLKEINPEYSLEGPMLKVNLQYFGCEELTHWKRPW